MLLDVRVALILVVATLPACDEPSLSCAHDDDCAAAAPFCVAGICVVTNGGEGEGEGGEGEGAEGEGAAGEGEGAEGEGEDPCPGGTDVDGDGFGDGCQSGGDCDDGNGAVHALLDAAQDDDGDGATFGAVVSVCSDGVNPPPGFALQSADDDCDETNPAVQTGCGPCFTRAFGGRSFTACEDLHEQFQAQAQCGLLDKSLASIHSQAEQDFAVATLLRLGLTDRVWIGLEEGPERWLDGSPLDYFAFPNGATQGSNGFEDCVVILFTQVWDDDDCTGHNLPYLCATAP